MLSLVLTGSIGSSTRSCFNVKFPDFLVVPYNVVYEVKPEFMLEDPIVIAKREAASCLLAA